MGQQPSSWAYTARTVAHHYLGPILSAAGDTPTHGTDTPTHGTDAPTHGTEDAIWVT